MMKTKSILAAALLAFSMTTVAQETPEYRFQKHAYLQVQGGAQYTLGEASFSDLLSPNVQVAAGYRFSPVFGVRLAVSGWESRGGFNGYVGNDGLAGNINYSYKHIAPGIDLTLDLTNAIGGYNPHRAVSLTLFAGGGANIAFNNGEAQDINAAGYEMAYIWDGTKVRPFGRGGIGIDFRLSDAVSLGIEGNANVVSDKYNSKKAGNADWYFNALAGIKIALGKTSRKAAAEVPVMQAVVPAAEPAGETPAPAADVKEKAAEAVAPMRKEVFFAINSCEITADEHAKITELAQYMKEHPAAKAVLTGYADAGTGTQAINERLSAGRAEAVAGVLTKVYGIDAARIKQRAEGSRVQPFAENDMNRVTICTAE